MDELIKLISPLPPAPRYCVVKIRTHNAIKAEAIFSPEGIQNFPKHEYVSLLDVNA